MSYHYSTEEEKQAFLENTANARTLVIADMDGNFPSGLNLTDKGKTLLASNDAAALKKAGFNPDRTIPNIEGFDPVKDKEYLEKNISILPTDDWQKLAEGGYLERKVFAKCGMDVRLSPESVATINKAIDTNAQFTFAGLTSRPYREIMYILKTSGVKDPKKLTLVADSGNTVQANGEIKTIVTFNEKEAAYLDAGVQNICDDVNREIETWPELIAQRDTQKAAKGDKYVYEPLTVQKKGDIARNIHFRKTLEDSLGIEETNPLAERIAHLVKEKLSELAYAEAAPKELDKSGKQVDVLTVIPGQATFEIKPTRVTKAGGVLEIMEAAKTHHAVPEKVIFTGDDMFAWNKTPDGKLIPNLERFGTDYPAAMLVKGQEIPGLYDAGELKKRFPEVEGFVMYTHHPLREVLEPATTEQEKQDSITQNPAKAIPEGQPLHPGTPGTGIDLIHPTPPANANFITQIVEQQLDRHIAETPKHKIMTYHMSQHSAPEANAAIGR